MRASAISSVLIGLYAGICACVAIYLTSLAWAPSKGRIAPALLAPLLLAVARPLMDRIARRIAARGDARRAVDGPRVLWTSLALLSPLFVVGEMDSFFYWSFRWPPWITLGFLGLQSIDDALGFGIVLASPLAGLVSFVIAHAMRAFRKQPLPVGARRPRVSPWSLLLLAGCLIPVPMAVQRAMIAPSAAEYEARLTSVGTIAAITMPSGPRPRADPESQGL